MILDKEDFRDIYRECFEVFTGNPQKVPLEVRMLEQYDRFGSNYAMPWVFECIERGMTCAEVLKLTFPKGTDEIGQNGLIDLVDKWRDANPLEEEEEIQVAVDPVAPPATPPKAKVKVARKSRQKSSESLSQVAGQIYTRLFTDNPKIRNVDAQRAIAGELDITDPKQLNSLRALVVRWKREMRNGA